LAPRASQDRPRCARGLPRPSLFHLGASNGSAVCRFQKTHEKRTPFFTFCFATSFCFATLLVTRRPQELPRKPQEALRSTQSCQGAPKSTQGAPKSSQRVPKELPWRSQRAPKSSQGAPKSPQGSLCLSRSDHPRPRRRPRVPSSTPIARSPAAGLEYLAPGTNEALRLPQAAPQAAPQA